jgi:hypothetical protein
MYIYIILCITTIGIRLVVYNNLYMRESLHMLCWKKNILWKFAWYHSLFLFLVTASCLLYLQRAADSQYHSTVFLPPQIMFATVTEQNLVLNKKRSSIYAIIMSCIAGSPVVVLWVYPPYLECWQLVCYIVSFVVMCLVAHLFGSIYRSIITAATLLNTCFKVRKNLIYTYIHNAMLSCLCLQSLFPSPYRRL